jgi:hypothetical protein
MPSFLSAEGRTTLPEGDWSTDVVPRRINITPFPMSCISVSDFACFQRFPDPAKGRLVKTQDICVNKYDSVFSSSSMHLAISPVSNRIGNFEGRMALLPWCWLNYKISMLTKIGDHMCLRVAYHRSSRDIKIQFSYTEKVRIKL